MVRRVEVGRGDLEPPAEREADSPPQMKAPQDETGRHKILLLAVILSVLKERRVELYFRPKLPKNSILEGVVPGKGATQDIRVSRRQPNSKCAL